MLSSEGRVSKTWLSGVGTRHPHHYRTLSTAVTLVERGFAALGRELGVSDNAIRKHLRSQGVRFPKKGRKVGSRSRGRVVEGSGL